MIRPGQNTKMCLQMTSTMRRLVLAAAALLVLPSISFSGAQASFMYKLSDFSGPVPSLWARVTVDPEEGEVYSLNRSESAIQIYNNTAMQIFGYGEDLGLATATDIAAGENGEAYLLYSYPTGRILHLDYNGIPLEEIHISGIPADLQPFNPEFIDIRNNTLYLSDGENMKVVVATLEGEFAKGYAFRDIIKNKILASMEEPGISNRRKESLKKEAASMDNVTINGFSASQDGTLYFTASSLFSAFRQKEGSDLEQFGVAGGAIGKFGVVAGIESDKNGNIFVADRLRSVVLVFDKDFNFLTEFGYRGPLPQNLIVPDDIAVDDQTGKIYVSQAGNLGVSVFSVDFGQK